MSTPNQPGQPGTPGQQPNNPWARPNNAPQQPGNPGQPGQPWNGSQQTPPPMPPQGGQPGGPMGPRPGAPMQPGQPGFGPRPGGPAGPGAPMGPGGQPPFGGRPGQPGQPYGFGATPAGPKKGKTPLWIGLGIGALVLALIAAFFMTRGGDDEPTPAPTSSSSSTTDPSGSSDPSGNGSEPPATGDGDRTTPKGVVELFMNSLVKGDAETLLSTLQNEPNDTTFITNEVLGASAKHNAITDVVVEEPADEYKPVHVSYTIKGKKVKEKFTVRKGYDEEEYKISLYPSSVGLYSAKAADMGLKLNGVAVEDTSVILLPGVYDITTDNKYYDYGTKQLVVTSFSNYTSPKLAPKLTAEAQKQVRAAAKAKLASCTNRNLGAIEVPTCGLAFKSQTWDGTKANPKYMVCKVTEGANALDRSELRPDYTDPLQIKSYTSVRLSCELKSTTGQKLIGRASFYQYTADLSASPIKVTFS